MTYDYRAVRCPSCGWRGRRSYKTNWPACPRCGGSGNEIIPDEKSPEADTKLKSQANHREYISLMYQEREKHERALLKELKQKYETTK